MKRFSKRIRKRLSISSRENGRSQSEGNIYDDGVPSQEQRELPMANSAKLPAPPTNPDDAINGNIYSNGAQEASPSSDLDNHDYSTLDGDDDDDDNGEVFPENANAPSQQPTVPPRSPRRQPFRSATVGDLLPRTNTPPNSNGLRSRAKSAGANNSGSSQPLMKEFQRLARKGWYWGPMAREQAEKKLCNLPEASFLVRDSSDDRYLLSLSFRSNHRTLHTRIEHSGMKFSFYEDSPRQSYTSVIELIENSVRDSTEQGVFCYSRSRQPNAQTFPVRLMHPVSRFTEVRPLQDLCRFVIRQYTRIDHIQSLPLPKQIKGYLNQSYF